MCIRKGSLGDQKHSILRTSLVVQWLRLRAPNAGGPGMIPGQGTRSRSEDPNRRN